VLYQAGIIRELYFRQDAHSAVLILECRDSEEAAAALATLSLVKALAAAEDSLRDGPAARTGVESLLSLWTQSTSQHPYMFFMGTDFRKLKVPFVWYDLMHVLDILSRFPWLRGDLRLHDMLETMSAKADPQGRFTIESVWTAWKEWEFGQKKVPSRWLTLAAWRIRQRMEAAPA